VSGSGHQSFSGTGSSTSLASSPDQHGNGTTTYDYTQSDNYSFTDTSAVHDIVKATSSTTFYASGVLTFGDYSLDSLTVNNQSSASETYIFSDTSHSAGSGTSSVTLHEDGQANQSWGIRGGSGSGNGTMASFYSYANTEDTKSNGTVITTDSSTGYAAGSMANGVTSLSSLLYQANGSYHVDLNDSGTWVDGATVSTSERGGGSSTGTQVLGGGGLGTSQLSGSGSASRIDASIETITSSSSEFAEGSYTTYEEGTVANGSLSLSSV